MSRYTLRDDGYPFKKIMHGKKWVGRVTTHADGGYVGIINLPSGSTESARAATEVLAFEVVVARRLGFKTVAELKAANSQARANNRARNAHARYVASEMLKGNFEPLDRVLGITKGETGK